jgi:hypothetical protein
MAKNRFTVGQKVAYKAKKSPSIHMRNTVVVGFNGVKENHWFLTKCTLSGDKRWRLDETKSRPEPQYIVEHYFGWRPTDQPKGMISSDVNLDPGKNYMFAYQSELSNL